MPTAYHFVMQMYQRVQYTIGKATKQNKESLNIKHALVVDRMTER